MASETVYNKALRVAGKLFSKVFRQPFKNFLLAVFFGDGIILFLINGGLAAIRTRVSGSLPSRTEAR